MRPAAALLAAAAAGLLAGGIALPLARSAAEDPCSGAGFVAGAYPTFRCGDR